MCIWRGFNYQAFKLYGYAFNDFLDEKHIYS